MRGPEPDVTLFSQTFERMTLQYVRSAGGRTRRGRMLEAAAAPGLRTAAEIDREQEAAIARWRERRALRQAA